MTSLPLFDRGPSAEERFRAFHEANPQVFAELVRRAKALKARGHGHMGIRMLWEAMRHDWMLETKDPTSGFKLNDHYPPFYARLIMQREPELRGIFEVRGESA